MQIEQLGPYRLGRKLGRGGMGTVYAAVEDATNATAAVKVLSASLAREEGFRDRFEAEIETLRKLRHPNIVRLFGFGEQNETLFYAMELVEGTSLEEELHAGRRFNWREVTQIGIQVCRALRHAHDHGVIHRDIKPANLLLSNTGEVKLSDFGIAKLFGNTGLTGDGSVIGTAEYMAPEQADGRPVTYRCDLYSLGGVLYALCAGRPPFRARSLPEMLQLQRFADAEPLRRYAPDVPAELEQIVAELLAKEPESRIPTALVLARRLEAMEHGLTRRENREHAGAADLHDSGTMIANDSGAMDANGSAALESRPASGLDRTQVTGSGVEAADDVEFTIAPVVNKLSPADTAAPSASTRAGDRTRAEAGKAPATGNVNETQATTGLAAEPEAAPAPPSRVSPAPSGTGRFTHVSEDDRASGEASPTALISPQTWVLIGALLMIGFGTWYFLQPISPDKLYGRVMARADKEQIEELVDAEPDIQAFLAAYPGDPRADKLRELSAEIDLHRRERQLQRRGRYQGKEHTLSPIERAYFAAMKLADLDPEQGARRLQAILDLFSGDGNLTDVDRQALELARRQLERLTSQTQTGAEDDLALVRKQLERAGALAETDPQAAATIWHSLIELYSDKPWAADEVAKARAALESKATAKSPE